MTEAESKPISVRHRAVLVKLLRQLADKIEAGATVHRYQWDWHLGAGTLWLWMNDRKQESDNA